MPRSPSRDVVDRFTGNRAYFHRADPLRRWKNLVALGAVGLTLGWLVVEFALPIRAANAHSHGTLANPHAAFDSNCQACHNSHSGSDFLSNPLSVFTAQDRWHDLSCTKCHAGPAHHASVKDAAFHDRCSNCHHDHNGRDFSLVKMDDSHCTKCHADLPAAHVSGQSAFASTVTHFAKDHPEFRSLKVDRALKFSHALHMTPGLAYSANDQRPWTPESLGKQFGPETQSRYSSASGNPAEPVQLTCASCHQLDASELPTKSLLPGRTDGAYYLPVNFEQHCQSCHPLQTPAASSVEIAIKEFSVPHRRQPAELKDPLRAGFATRLLAGKNPLLNKPLGPGGRLDPAAQTTLDTLGTELDRLTNTAMRSLTQNLSPRPEHGNAPTGGFACGKCHYSTGPGKTDVLPLPNKSIWFEHATFNHVSHRGLTCASCHPGTEAAFAPNGAVNEREPVLIRGVKSCQACHGPAPDAAGIRHSCTDCHRYHNGDRPLQGLGSPHRSPKNPLNLEQFLRGGMDQP
jgi:hypothetical protein